VLCPSLQNRKKLKAITRLELELLGIAVTYPTECGSVPLEELVTCYD